MNHRPTVVIGATRGTGAHVVRMLLDQGRPVRVGARTPGKATALFGPSVPVVQVELASPGAALDELMSGAGHVVFTAGVPPGPAREAALEAVDFRGTVAAVEAARRAGLPGRFLYMTTMGLHHPGVLIRVLNLVKRNIITWRTRAERAVLDSGLDAAVVRAGLLTDGPARARRLVIQPGDHPVTMSTQVSRADMARVLVAALDAPVLPRDLSVFSVRGTAQADGELQRTDLAAATS